MAQANATVTPFPSKIEEAQAARISFFEMEADIRDLASMAKLALSAVHCAIGETEFDHDVVTDHTLTQETVTSALFAVSHLSDMIKALERRYYASPAFVH